MLHRPLYISLTTSTVWPQVIPLTLQLLSYPMERESTKSSFVSKLVRESNLKYSYWLKPVASYYAGSTQGTEKLHLCNCQCSNWNLKLPVSLQLIIELLFPLHLRFISFYLIFLILFLQFVKYFDVPLMQRKTLYPSMQNWNGLYK